MPADKCIIWELLVYENRQICLQEAIKNRPFKHIDILPIYVVFLLPPPHFQQYDQNGRGWALFRLARPTIPPSHALYLFHQF